VYKVPLPRYTNVFLCMSGTSFPHKCTRFHFHATRTCSYARAVRLFRTTIQYASHDLVHGIFDVVGNMKEQAKTVVLRSHIRESFTFHENMYEVSRLLACYSLLISKYLLMFRKFLMPSCSGSSNLQVGLLFIRVQNRGSCNIYELRILGLRESFI
jgi:hypothetical protein